MSKQFWGILIAIIVVFFGVVALTGNKDDKSSGVSGKPTSHIEGTSPKGVKLVEYGDYQCPGCGSFYPVVSQVAEKYSDKVQFQFRNLPLPSLHPNAFAAARAAEAAGLQGKFWEMNAKLYEQNGLYYSQQTQNWIPASDPMPYFEQYAREIGLDVAKFKQDYASSKVNKLINADIAAFEKTGDDKATPTFYLNGKKVDNQKLVDDNGQPSVEAFSKLLDAALKAN